MSLHHLIGRRAANSPARKSLDRITGTNGWIIGYLASKGEKEVFQRDLEKEFTITRSTASKIVNLMVQKGLIIRESVPHDARLKRLVLTPYSWELAKEMRDDRDSMEAMLTEGLTDEQLRVFFECVDKMKENIKNH